MRKTTRIDGFIVTEVFKSKNKRERRKLLEEALVRIIKRAMAESSNDEQ
jgi:hypothetical protein